MPPGDKYIDCHMIFDVNLGENYRRKSRLVPGSHQIEVPTSIKYSSVVYLDLVSICLLISALNDLKVLTFNIQNEYLTASFQEKVCTRLGSKFGSYTGKIMIITRALYGLESERAILSAFLSEHMYGM